MVRFAFIFIIIATQTLYAENSNENAQAKPVLSYLQAAILGSIQGITEFLPISSTGHLILTNSLFQIDSEEKNSNSAVSPDNYSIKNALDSYSIVIQGGTIFAIIFLYWKRIRAIIEGFIGRNPKGKKLARNILLAFLPAACLGLLLGKWIEKHLFSPQMVMIALIFGAILMFGSQKLKLILKDKKTETIDLDLEDLTVKQCLSIGVLQCLAMWPGTSRSMITIVGGYLVGLSVSKAAEFSFLLGIVTLSAASGYKIITDGANMKEVLTLGPAIFGCAVAFVTGAIAIKWLISYLTSHGLSIFAWYRLFLAFGIFFATHF